MRRTQSRAPTLPKPYSASNRRGDNSMLVQEYLKNKALLFDGAMGSYFSAKFSLRGQSPEIASISEPDKVLEIHREYVTAGSDAVKTNTFGVNRKNFDEETCRRLIEASVGLAKNCRSKFVFADIGPIALTDSDKAFEEYKFIIDLFAQQGVRNFLFETNSDIGVLEKAAEYISLNIADSFTVLSFAVLPDGFTRSGAFANSIFDRLEKNPAVNAIGLNCLSSSAHMAKLARGLARIGKPVCIMPNAGYPSVIGSKAVYDGTPEFFAESLSQLPENVKMLGGCCGTGPAHIKALKTMLTEKPSRPVRITVEPSPVEKKPESKNPFFDALCDPDRKPIAVELDPPENADTEKFIRGARELAENGAEMITIADCPIARARMDSSLLACKLHRELGIEAIPHMTCRDRNLNATKALLLGLCAEDVHNVLAITGDPIPTESRDEVKSVYNFNSRMLASYIRTLGETVLPVPFKVYGALNVNARNFSVQIKMAKEKEKNGMCGFFTQPILTPQGFENLKIAKNELEGKILGGIIPVVSYRNACFMNSEVNGISVDEKIIAMYEGADREKGEELAVEISTAIAKEIAPYIDGYYLITPFNRTALMARILRNIKHQ